MKMDRCVKEKQYYTFLNHFLKTDLLKIANLSDTFLSDKNTCQLSRKITNSINDVVFHSSKTMDILNSVFDIDRSLFDEIPYKEKYNLLEIIDDSIHDLYSDFSFSCPVLINRENLDLKITCDQYLKDVFAEVLFYILKSNYDNSSVAIDGSHFSDQFCVFIQDQCTQQISQDTLPLFPSNITDDSKSREYYIGISVASILMQIYGGKIDIHPNKPRGNEFRLFFPSRLISSSEKKNKPKYVFNYTRIFGENE